jgi:hypothetical protein
MRAFPASLICTAAWCVALLTGVSANGGQLSGSFTNLTSGAQINLSAGSADWVHWGEENSRTVNRKAGVGPQISAIETIPADPGYYVSYFRKTDSPISCTWIDGAPTLGRTNTTNYVWMYCQQPIGTGFRLSVPADTRSRTLKLYVGVESGQETLLSASLSDASASPYIDSTLKTQGNVKIAAGAYFLTYSANSPGQRLNIDWILTGGQQGDVKLQAAVLVTPGISARPLASIISPTNGQSFSPLSIPVSVSASDVDGVVTNLAVYLDGLFQGNKTNSPWDFLITNAMPGLHQLTAVATDNMGETSTSTPVVIAVYSGNSRLNGQLTKFPAEEAVLPVDLSAEGSLDWINWGYLSPTDVSRKSSVPSLISDYLHSGTNVPISLDAGCYFTWSWFDGSPTLENFYSANGIQVRADTNGFQIQLESSPQGRRAKVYLGDYGCKATVRAYFTNHSAPMFYQDYNLIDIYQTVDAMCEIRYASQSPSSVVVKIEASELYDVLFGGTRLMSATVQPDNTVLLPLQLTNPQATQAGPAFSFFTQPDHNYVVEFTPTLPATNWNNVTTLPGIGNWLTITNPPFLGDQGYYRVRTQ